jgi:hypothetical protein
MMDQDKLPLLIFVNKGIEVGTNALTLDIIADTCGKKMARAATFIVIQFLPDLIILLKNFPVWTIFCKRK